MSPCSYAVLRKRAVTLLALIRFLFEKKGNGDYNTFHERRITEASSSGLDVPTNEEGLSPKERAMLEISDRRV